MERLNLNGTAKLYAAVTEGNATAMTQPDSGTLREMLEVALALDEETFASCMIMIDNGPTLLPDQISQVAAKNSIEDD